VTNGCEHNHQKWELNLFFGSFESNAATCNDEHTKWCMVQAPDHRNKNTLSALPPRAGHLLLLRVGSQLLYWFRWTASPPE